jgi:hypothetical protein
LKTENRNFFSLFSSYQQLPKEKKSFIYFYLFSSICVRVRADSRLRLQRRREGREGGKEGRGKEGRGGKE